MTAHDFKVADFLARQMERFARINRYGQTGNEADLNPNVANRNKGIAKSRKRIFQRGGCRKAGGNFLRPVFRLSARMA
jgi:hypothetical protein